MLSRRKKIFFTGPASQVWLIKPLCCRRYMFVMRVFLTTLVCLKVRVMHVQGNFKPYVEEALQRLLLL